MSIAAFFQGILEWFQNLFWKQEMELTLVGLQNSGKTTLVDVISVRDDRIPYLCVSAEHTEHKAHLARTLHLARSTD